MILKVISQALVERRGGLFRRNLFFNLQEDRLEVTWSSDESIWAISGTPVEHTLRIRLDGDKLFLSDPEGSYNFRGKWRFDLCDPKSIDLLVSTVEEWVEDNEADAAMEDPFDD